MSNNTTATITGNVTRDPEARFTNSGKAVASFGVAVSESETETSFFDVTAWESLAENVVASISKGDRVVVTGRLKQSTWETQEGDKRSKIELIADEVGPSLRWASAVPEKNPRPAA